MDTSEIYCMLEDILAETQGAIENESDENSQEHDMHKQLAANTIYGKLSADANTHGNFYRLLTFDTGETASRDRVLQSQLLIDSCPLDNGRHEKLAKAGFFRRPKASSSGLVSTLPVDLLHMILEEYLDIASLTTLRRVSRGIRAEVDGVPKYATIMGYAPQSIRAALTTQAASGFTCHDLWKAFVVKECDHCGKFGAYLYLARCSRVCYQCAMESQACLPLDLASVKKYYSITKYELIKYGAPVIEPLPGRYHNSKQDGMNVTCLVDMMTAAKVAARVYGVKGSASYINYRIQALKTNIYTQSLSTFLSCSAKSRRKFIHKPEPAYIKFVHDAAWLNPHRLKCVTPFPWIDRADHVLTMGVSCRGCFDEGETPDQLPRRYATDIYPHKQARVTYTHRDYIDHFLRCLNSLQRWLENPYGRSLPLHAPPPPQTKPSCLIKLANYSSLKKL